MEPLQPLIREAALAQVPIAYQGVTSSGDPTVMASIDSLLQGAWAGLIPFSVFLSLLFGMGLVYTYLRLKHVEQMDAKRYEAVVSGETVVHGPTDIQKRWARIMEHAQTTNENDWRHAIIEADIILDELLDAQGYKGDTMGDKLKQVERSDFRTIDMAWEAHKVRNRVAHEGSALSLNEREVRRVMSLFEHVFKEFHII